MSGSPTRYFVLSGLVVHELRWAETLGSLVAFRKAMRRAYGLKEREEFHAAQFLSKPGALRRIPKFERYLMIRHFAQSLASIPHISVITILVDKQAKPPGYDPFEFAWKCLIQRFENTISHHNFPGPKNPDDKGIMVPDATDQKKLTSLLRKMRVVNHVPSQQGFGAPYRNLVLRNMVEDPVFRDSSTSLYVQAADLCAFLAYQQESPSAYFRKQGGHHLYQTLAPIHCKVASSSDPQGIVRL